jgi:hypothetical protein
VVWQQGRASHRFPSPATLQNSPVYFSLWFFLASFSLLLIMAMHDGVNDDAYAITHGLTLY